MKKGRFIKATIFFLLIVILVLYAKSGHFNLPGHGNWEDNNLKNSVVNHVSPTLRKGRMVEFGGKFSCEDYKDNKDNEVRFSANVIYYVVSNDGKREQHIAHIVTNEDKDSIIEWNEIKKDPL